MEGERRFAFIPVALPHFVSLPLPPSVSLPPRPSPSFSRSLRCHPFLPHISHQCPLWSKRASHIKFCLRHFQEGCCIQVAFWKHRLILQAAVAAVWSRGHADRGQDGYLGLWNTVPFFSVLGVTCRFRPLMDPSANTSPLLSGSAPCSLAAASTSIFHFGKFAVTRISTIRGKFFTWIAIFYMEKAIKGEPTLSLSLLSSLQPSLPVFPAWLVHSSALHL